MWWEFAVCAAIGYALGSIPSGLIVGRVVRRVDIREYGSGKTGFTNALRTVGPLPAGLVLALDVGKGVLAVLVAWALSDSPWAVTAGALGAVAGHDWPAWAGFRGGRGVATSAAGLLMMNPLATLALVPVAAVLLFTTRIMSVMSMGIAIIAAGVFGALAALSVHPWAYAAYALIAGALVVVLHRANIERLLAGAEPKLGSGGQRRAESSVANTGGEASAG